MLLCPPFPARSPRRKEVCFNHKKNLSHRMALIKTSHCAYFTMVTIQRGNTAVSKHSIHIP